MTLSVTRRVERTGTNPSREEGLIGNFGMVTDTPLGPIGLQLGAEQIEAGQRLSGSISRTLETPTGALSGSVGAARQPGGDVNLIGTVGWSQPLPTGNINVALSRASVGNEDPRVRTTLSTGLTHQINSVSSIGLRADYARTDASALRGSLEQATVSATYSHQLTPDWALNSGVSYRQRREASGATARSPEVFLGMGRSFEWPL